MKINIHQETCCDYCGRPIHVHFDCPACGTINAGSDYTSDVVSDMKEDGKCELKCGECGAVFVAKGEDTFDYDEWEWEKVK